jgi:Secretion system C-terminal sorting domain
MKTIIVYISIFISASLLYGQSTMVYGSNTSLYVGPGSDLCAATITVNGTFSGGGTFCNSPAGIEADDNGELPKEYSLSQNYPNPFNPVTLINFELPENGFVTLKVYDILGNEIVKLIDEEKPAGRYNIPFDAKLLPSGVYYFRLSSNKFNETKKMILLK